MKRTEYLKWGSEEEGRAEGARQERESRKRAKNDALAKALPWIGRRVYLKSEGLLFEVIVTDAAYRNGLTYYEIRPARGEGKAELCDARIVFPASILDEAN